MRRDTRRGGNKPARVWVKQVDKGAGWAGWGDGRNGSQRKVRRS